MTSRDPNNPPPRAASNAAAPRRQPARQASDRVERAQPADRATAAERARPGAPPPVRSRDTRDPLPASAPDTEAVAPFRVSVGGGTNRQVRSAAPASPSPASDDPNDPAAWADLADDWAAPGNDEWEAIAAEPAPRPAVSRRRGQERPAAVRPARTSPTAPPVPSPAARAARRARPTFALPDFAGSALAVGGALLRDQIAGILLGANVLSLIALIVRVATLVQRLPPTIVTQLDAAGIPSQWAAPEMLWRLPVIAGMVLLMNLVVAWFVAPIDRFAARFALGAALGIQLLVWIAVLDFV